MSSSKTCGLPGCKRKGTDAFHPYCTKCSQSGKLACNSSHHAIMHVTDVAQPTAGHMDAGEEAGMVGAHKYRTNHLVGVPADSYHTLMEMHVVHTIHAAEALRRNDKEKLEDSINGLKANARVWQNKIGGEEGAQWFEIFWEHTGFAKDYIVHMHKGHLSSASKSVDQLKQNMKRVVAFWSEYANVPDTVIADHWTAHLLCTVAYVTELRKSGIGRRFEEAANDCRMKGQVLGDMLDAYTTN